MTQITHRVRGGVASPVVIVAMAACGGSNEGNPSTASADTGGFGGTSGPATGGTEGLASTSATSGVTSRPTAASSTRDEYHFDHPSVILMGQRNGEQMIEALGW